MRKAEEIAADVFNRWAMSSNERDAMVKVINEARKEAIEECALKAEIEINGTYDALGTDVRQSILQLIEQLK